jgi:hypothetical protein
LVSISNEAGGGKITDIKRLIHISQGTASSALVLDAFLCRLRKNHEGVR